MLRRFRCVQIFYKFFVFLCDRANYEKKAEKLSTRQPVAPVVQLVTSKPSDVGRWDVNSNVDVVTRSGIFPH